MTVEELLFRKTLRNTWPSSRVFVVNYIQSERH